MLMALIALQDALGGQYGTLSRPKLRLLLKLTHSSLTISELAERLNISSPGVTQMIDKLQAEGIVARHSPVGDQRTVCVTLTETGRQVLHIAEAAFLTRVQSLLKPLSPEEQENLLTLLKKITDPTMSYGKKMTLS
ncbi:MAG: HTH domain-containing protein [Sulfobacillus thermosulfidooxidans]|nr:MarR family transcriptional regulator [Sulfobacillus sp. hq2]PSR36449.1 MAG: HTH domain-containing protein [Sulfobacillus thermosulfidooxidans]